MKLSLRVDPSDLKAGFAVATKSISLFQSGLGKVQTFAKGIDDSLKSLGKRAAGFSTGMALAIGTSVAAASKLESSMRNVNSILGDTEEQFKANTAAILDMSTSIPKAATDLADGMYEIASSGFDGAEALTILEQSGIAATAGMTDTATSAKAISGAINTWQLDVGEAGDVADILFKTVESGVVTFEELALQMSDFTGIAEAVGLELDEVSAAFAALTLSGMPASRAGTALSGVLNKLIKPTELLGETTSKLGYENAVTMVQTLGLKDTLLQLSDAVDGDVTAMSKMFEDVEGLRGVLALTSNDATLFEQALSDIANESNRAGAAQAAYAEQSKSVANKIELFKNSVTALRIELGQYYLPALGAIVGKATEFLSFFRDAPEPVKKMAAVLMGLSTVLSAIVALLVVSAVRSKIFSIALGGLKAGTVSHTLATKVGIINARSFSGALIGVATAATRGAAAARVGERSQSRLTIALNRSAMAAASASGKVTNLAVGTSRSSLSVASLAARSSKLQISLLRLSGTLGGVSSRLSALSSSASASGARFSTMASRMRLAERASSGLGRATAALKARMGMMVTGAFVVMDIMQSWAATANEARESAKSLRSEVEENYDTSSLEGMRDSYSELYDTLSEKAGIEFDKSGGTDFSKAFGLAGMAADMAGLDITIRDIKGGLETLNPFDDNKIQKEREEIIALSEELQEMERQYNRAKATLDLFSSATGLSSEEGERLAKTLGIDLTQGVGMMDRALISLMSEMDPAEAQAFAESTDSIAVEMVAATMAIEGGTYGVSELGSQLEALRSPLAGVIEQTIELTDAQKDLQSAAADVGSFGAGLSEALQREKDAQQEIVDEQLKNIEKANEEEMKHLEDSSEARIEAAQDRVEAAEDGSEEQKRLQDELEDLRDRENESLAEHRDTQKEILDQERDDLQQSVEDRKLSLGEMTQALMDQNAKLAEWQQNLVTVSGRTSADVAGYLASMGSEGVELVEMMATGSKAEVEAMEEAIVENMRLTGEQSAVELDAGMTLAERAAADGGKKTRQALIEELGLLPTDAARVMREYGRAIQDGVNAANFLVGAPMVNFIPSEGLTTSQIQDNEKSQQLKLRQRATGGIDSAAHIAMQPNVLYGERSTGGEAFIPLGKSHRPQSMKIWEETGKILGVIPMAAGGLIPSSSVSSGSSTTSTTISKKNSTNFTGDIYLRDPVETLRYAERRKRMASLRGGDD